MIRLTDTGSVLYGMFGAIMSLPIRTTVFSGTKDEHLTPCTDGGFIYADRAGNTAEYRTLTTSFLDGFTRYEIELVKFFDQQARSEIFYTPYAPTPLSAAPARTVLEDLKFVEATEPYAYVTPFGFPFWLAINREEEPATEEAASIGQEGCVGCADCDCAPEDSEIVNSRTRAIVHYGDGRDSLVFEGYDVTDLVDGDGCLTLQIDGATIVPAFGWTYFVFEDVKEFDQVVGQLAPAEEMNEPGLYSSVTAAEALTRPVLFTEEQIAEAFGFLTRRAAH